jgi:N6-adenosine-specific RNA methylase IME4
MTIRIDPEFKALIAPLKPDEREQLEANLVANGCRDSLVLWKGILIDGHNRYEICERRGIKYDTVEMALPSREHVLLWIEENQLGRRNLTDDQRAPIVDSVVERREKLSRIERARKGGKAGGRHHPKVSLGATPSPKLNDRSKKSVVQVSRAAKVSEWKVRQVREIKKKKPAALAAIRAGDKTIREIQAEIKRAEKQRVAEAIRAEAPNYPDGPFRVIVVDPPWKYDVRGEDSTHRARNPYPDMTLDEIRAVPIPEMAHADCVLWLWTTNAFLVEAAGLIEKWGFQRKTLLTWAKDRMGTGDWLRGQTEHCWMAVRGKPVVTLTNQTTLLKAPLREHSRKPDEFYALVEALCPGNKCELYARQQREGWESFGAEKERFAS